jgi:hypothetical protein
MVKRCGPYCGRSGSQPMHVTRVLAAPVPSHLSTAARTHSRRASRAAKWSMVRPRDGVRRSASCQKCSRLALARQVSVVRRLRVEVGVRGAYAGTRHSSTASTSRQLRRTSSSRASSSRSAPSHRRAQRPLLICASRLSCTYVTVRICLGACCVRRARIRASCCAGPGPRIGLRAPVQDGKLDDVLVHIEAIYY